MKIEFTVKDFDLGATLMCGQAFRWTEECDGSYDGVVRGAVVSAKQDGDTLSLDISAKSGVAAEETLTEDFWRNYFALDIDYTKLHDQYRRNPVLRDCVDFSPGIRVLRQDFYETFISFIISQNNNITRIRSIVKKLSELFGKEAGEGADGRKLYAFPDAESLAAQTDDALAPLRAGYRVPSILGGAKLIAGNEISEEMFSGLSTADARKKLLGVYGVGPKIADCVLLFGLGRFESFPIDVWVKRAMTELFPDGLPECAVPTAGIAQQYIFHYMRTRI